VLGLVEAGVDVLLYPGSMARPVPDAVETRPTLSRGSLRLPYRLLGKLRTLGLHDRIVARRLESVAGSVDVIHLWPCAALHTIRKAKQLGIPTVLERPNAHTRFAFDVVAAEHRRLGIATPHFDYQPNDALLAREEEEFRTTDFLLCPSSFVVDTFVAQGFSPDKLLRHQYGFDPEQFSPAGAERELGKRFTAIFVGVDAVRKGLHMATRAWLDSPASRDGVFQIAGGLTEEYKQRFAADLAHASIVQLGHRRDVPGLMRQADVLLMPTVEEGSALVCAEAIGTGCVPLASSVCIGFCQHGVNALVHKVGDVETLEQQLTEVYTDRALLARLRAGALKTSAAATWDEAGRVLADVYRQAVRAHGGH
jgi:glycosyltransferase involved in cell wall biosynthesis